MTTKITGSVLANTAVTIGTYGGTTQIPVVTVDQQGRVTLAANATPSIANTQITGTITNAQIASVANTKITGLVTSAQIASVANTQITGLVTSAQIASITSLQVTTALGYTPVSSVSGTAPVVSSGGTTPAISMPAATASANGYMTSTYASKLDGIAAGATNVTNTNQLTNGAGYITASSNTSTVVLALGVNTAAPATGEIRATGDITGFYSSDAKFKENVKPITNAVEIASAIGGKTFDWTDDYINNRGGEDGYFIQKSDFGVIAQDVQKVFPLAVRTRENGSLAVDYAKLTVLAFAAIAELKTQIDELKNK